MKILSAPIWSSISLALCAISPLLGFFVAVKNKQIPLWDAGIAVSIITAISFLFLLKYSGTNFVNQYIYLNCGGVAYLFCKHPFIKSPSLSKCKKTIQKLTGISLLILFSFSVLPMYAVLTHETNDARKYVLLLKNGKIEYSKFELILMSTFGFALVILAIYSNFKPKALETETPLR